ncbi:MAG: polymorphic toxin-type HINT domain-containing protein, partial [Pirellulales bacterium]
MPQPRPRRLLSASPRPTSGPSLPRWCHTPLSPGRWVDAGDVRVDDVLLLMDGRRIAVDEIQVRQVAQKVYNFQVAALHNYAVGPERVLVHNNSAASDATRQAASLARFDKKLPANALPTVVHGERKRRGKGVGG